MRHEIATSAKSLDGQSRDQITTILRRVWCAHQGPQDASVNDDTPHLRVIVHGNGAFLRDIVTELDINGFLS